MPDHDPSQPDPRLGTEHPDVTVHELAGGESYYAVRVTVAFRHDEIAPLTKLPGLGDNAAWLQRQIAALDEMLADANGLARTELLGYVESYATDDVDGELDVRRAVRP